MKLSHKFYSTEIVIDPQRINVIVIENPNELVDFISQLNLAIESEESKIYFTNDNQVVKPSFKFEFVLSVISLDINNKRVQNALIKRLNKELSVNYDYDINRKYGEMYAILDEAVKRFDGEIILNTNADITQLIKLFNPMFESVYDTLIEKIIAYIDICIDLFDMKYLAVLHAQEFLQKDDVIALFNHCRYKDVGVLLIESRLKYRLENESCLIIDEDLCEISL